MAHNNYLYQLRDIKFEVKSGWTWKAVINEGYEDYYGVDDIDGFLDVNYKICRDVICPAKKDADVFGMKFVGGNARAVESPEVFKDVYNTVIEAGLGPQFGDRQSEGRMPLAWYAPILEMQSGASPGIVMLVLTQEPAPYCSLKGTEKQKCFYPPYTAESGAAPWDSPSPAPDQKWATAPPKPSPLALASTKSRAKSSSLGDHDCVENFIHLVLAKTDGPTSTAGISSSSYPSSGWKKVQWVNGTMSPVNIEHKLGITAPPPAPGLW